MYRDEDISYKPDEHTKCPFGKWFWKGGWSFCLLGVFAGASYVTTQVMPSAMMQFLAWVI